MLVLLCQQKKILMLSNFPTILRIQHEILRNINNLLSRKLKSLQKFVGNRKTFLLEPSRKAKLHRILNQNFMIRHHRPTTPNSRSNNIRWASSSYFESNDENWIYFIYFFGDVVRSGPRLHSSTSRIIESKRQLCCWQPHLRSGGDESEKEVFRELPRRISFSCLISLSHTTVQFLFI